jgi:uncharacterized membrane protein YoaK (UPF0700 family)
MIPLQFIAELGITLIIISAIIGLHSFLLSGFLSDKNDARVIRRFTYVFAGSIIGAIAAATVEMQTALLILLIFNSLIVVYYLYVLFKYELLGFPRRTSLR